MKNLITLKFTLFFFIAAFAALSFTACSDVAGPNDASIQDGLVSQENDAMAEARRRAQAAAEAAAESTCSNTYPGSDSDVMLQYIEFKNENGVGSIHYEVIGTTLTVTFNGFFGAGVPDGENWSFGRTAVYVGANLDAITSGGGSLVSINQFPYINEYNTHPNTTSIHVIDLNDHPDIVFGGSFVMVTHGDAGPLNSTGTQIQGGASRKSVYAGNLIGGKQGNLFKYLSLPSFEPCPLIGTFSGAV